MSTPKNPYVVVVEIAPSDKEYTSSDLQAAELVRDHIRHTTSRSNALSPIVQSVNTATKERSPVPENRAKVHIDLITRELRYKRAVWTREERLFLDGVAHGLVMAHHVLDGASAPDALEGIIERMKRAVQSDGYAEDVA